MTDWLEIYDTRTEEHRKQYMGLCPLQRRVAVREVVAKEMVRDLGMSCKEAANALNRMLWERDEREAIPFKRRRSE